MKSKIQNPKSKTNPKSEIQNSKRVLNFNNLNLGFILDFVLGALNFRSRARANGFTLIELIVALGIFSALVVGAVGVTIQLMNAQQKAAAIQTVMDNLRFNIELMTREMRTGLNFIKSGAGLLNCGDSVGKEIRFTSFNQGPAQFRVYYLADTDNNGTGDAIMRIATPNISIQPTCAMAERFTSEDILVEDWSFLLRGEQRYPDDGQPFITINLRVKSKSAKILAETRMNLQATVTQREREDKP